MRFNFIGRFFASSQGDNPGYQYSGPLRNAFKRGKNPSFDSALQTSAFFAAVRLWAQVIASLPIEYFVKSGKEWKADDASKLKMLFDFRPNRYQTKTEFFETLIMNLMSHGNAYAMIDRQKDGQIISILPLYSGQMTVKILKGGKRVYAYNEDTGTKIIDEDKIWHLKLFGNSVIGMSALQYGANAIGLGLSSEERALQVMDNANKPSGILTYDSELELTAEQKQQLKDEFAALKEGKENVLMTIESGWKYQSVGMNPGDIQLLETRRFSVEEIARFMDVPSVLINDTAASSSWGTGIGEIVSGWLKLSVIPRLKNIENSMVVNLHPVEKIQKTKVAFKLDELTRLSRSELAEAQQKEINSGITTPNEARAERKLEPHPDGDSLYMNSALQPLAELLQTISNQDNTEQ